jgi:hypothetical protein
VGSQTFLQHDNKVLMIASPRGGFLREKAQKEGLKSLQASIALFNYQRPTPNWEIYVDGHRVDHLPYVAPAGVSISIRDGVSFVGVVTLPGVDLGGGNTVVLHEGAVQQWNKIVFKPALVIDSYNLKSENAVTNPDWDRISKAFGGFAVELADLSPSFDEFQKHLSATRVQTHFGDAARASVSYESGDDFLETKLLAANEELRLVEPKVNGVSTSLPAGVLRDTTTSVQGSIEKLGAVLRGDDGRMKFLQVEPKSRNYTGWNPLPDLAKFSLLVPGGVRVQSDGRIGLGQVRVDLGENRVIVSHAWGAGQEQDPNAATALVLTGFNSASTVEFNGVAQTDLVTRVIHGDLAYLVPLRATMKSVAEMEKALGDN